MNPILAPEAAPLIERVAHDRALLAFDFDGTLAPMVEDFREARLRDSTRRLLRMAAVMYPCAVVSGRGSSDLRARLQGIPLAAVVGNHGVDGAEWAADDVDRQVQAWSAALETAFRDEPGVQVERKETTLAVHYRRARDPEVCRRVAQAAAALPGARVFGGYEFLNVAPLYAPTKGDVLESLARKLFVRSVVFVGDGLTDEDAFRTPVVKLGIRVGTADLSSARHFIEDQSQVDDLLRALLTARSRHDGFGPRWLEWLEVFGAPRSGERT